MRSRYLLPSLLGLLALAVIGMAGWLWLAAPSGAAAIGGPFNLTDDMGHNVTERSYRGKWMLVYFGYTHCPDACPTTLSAIADALHDLDPKEQAGLVPLFITVDPWRDTPAIMQGYVHAFDPRIIGLTGTPAQIAQVEKEYRVYAAKHPLAHGDYAMDHSSIIYVMSPAGRFVTVLNDDLGALALASKLHKLGA